MKVASALTILTIGTVIAFAVPSTSTAVTRTPTPTPTPVPVTTVDFGPIKQDIREKGQKLVREIDLNINPKAGNTGCTLRVYKAREKAVVTSEDLFSSVVLLPDINYRGTLTGLNCQKISASKDVNSTKRYYTNLSRMMTNARPSREDL